MDIKEAEKWIGKPVIAGDEYWGVYSGELVSTFKANSLWRAKVKIHENLKYPRQDAIIFKDQRCSRVPYTTGTIEIFDLSDVVKREASQGVAS